MDHDVAWDEYRKQSAERVQKTSVAGKLDTIAAQLNEIQTDTERIAEVVPRILGDENAVEEANAGAEPPMEGGGLEGLLGGDGMTPEADPMQEDAADMGDEGGAPPMGDVPPEAGAPEGEPGVPMDQPMPEGTPPEPGTPMDEVPPMEGGDISGEDVPPAPGGAMGDAGSEDADVEVDMAFEDLVSTLQTSIEAAEEMGDQARADALLDMLDRVLDAWERESGGNEYVEEEEIDIEDTGEGEDMTAPDKEPVPEDEVKKSEVEEEVVKASPIESGSEDDGPDGTDEKPAEDKDAAEETSEEASSDPSPEMESSDSDGGEDDVPEASKTTDTESDNPIECSETPADSMVDEAGENPAAENLLNGPEPGDDMEVTIEEDDKGEDKVEEEEPSDPIKKSIPSFREMMETRTFAREAVSVTQVLKSQPTGVSEAQYEDICKSAPQGKPLMSLKDMMEMQRVAKASGGRPETPDQLVAPGDAINKSVKRVKWGPGVDPAEVMKSDWEAYKVYKSQNNL